MIELNKSESKQKKILKKMGIESKENFVEILEKQLSEDNIEIDYNLNLGWYILNKNIPFQNLKDRYIKSTKSYLETETDGKPISSFAYFTSGSRGINPKDKNNKNPINFQKLEKKIRGNYERGHLIASNLLRYIDIRPSDMRENKFFQVPKSNRFIESEKLQEYYPQRLLEIIIENIFEENNKEQARKNIFYENMKEYSLLKKYKIPEEKGLKYLVTLIYQDGCEVCCCINYQIYSTDDKFNLNIIIPNV